MRTFCTALLTVVSLMFLSSCAAPRTEAAPEYKVIATIKDIMDSEVDPSADYIWESIGTTVSDEGIILHQPKTDDEWKEERRRAITLVEAANLLMMPGRHVAKAGDKSENPGIELTPEEIEVLINNDRGAFIQLASKFQQTAIEQLDAVNRRDVDGMLKFGGDLDATCENCHRKYWYPNEPVTEPLLLPAPAGTTSSSK